ncbi:hypothetical protein B0A49_13957, partial [Cryomyces minteri]
MSNTINGYAPPPLTNPPPQIFGSLSANGSPLQPSLPANMFADDPNASGGDEHDQNDPKRRRIARVYQATYHM